MTTGTPQERLYYQMENTSAETAERITALLAEGALAEPKGLIPPVFVALRRANAVAVEALVKAGASLDVALTDSWKDWDDDGEIVIAAAGTTARQFFARVNKEERASRDIHPDLVKRLDALVAIVGAPQAKAEKAKPKKVAPKKATPAGFDGKWVEVRKETGSRRGAVKDGGVLVIKGDTFTRAGSITAGLPRKGKLTPRGDQRAYVDEDLEWSIVLSDDTLTITSPAEADEEHGFIYKSFLERVEKPSATKT